MSNSAGSVRETFELEEARSAPRKSLLECIAAPDSTERGSFCPHIDELDQDRLESTRSFRSSIFSEATEDKLAIDNPELHEQLERGTCGSYIIQGLALTAATMAYVLPVIIINWAKTVGHNEVGKPIKIDTFLGVSVIIFSKGFIVLLSLSCAFLWDRQSAGSASPSTFVKILLDPKKILGWVPVGGGYAIADVAEIMANGKVDAATYTILSQSRLIGTAIAMRVMIGTKRSGFQWSILLNLCLVLIGWQLTPNDFSNIKADVHSKKAALGYGFTCLKMLLSIICGVLSQRQLHALDVPMIIQQGHSCFAGLMSSIILAPILVFILYPLVGTPWTESWTDVTGNHTQMIGFFGGRPVPEPLPNAGDATGWNSKTMAVLGVYVFREIFCTYCIKRFDALVKNICNAVAMIVTYAIAVYGMHELPPNIVKFLFAMVICLEVFHYGLAEVPKKKQ